MTEDISQEFLKLIHRYFAEFEVDYLKDFPELDGYQVFSGDGHYINHASHAGRDSSGKNYAAGTLYAQNVRTGLLSVLDVITDGNRKSHEMPIFRKAVDARLKKEKTLWILDRAFVDKSWWPEKVKDQQHVIVRVKKKTVLVEFAELKFDATMDVNTGVTRFYKATMGEDGAVQRIIEYTDPETHHKYQFVTTLTHVEPGLIAWLYLLRWRIEKAFDDLKNNLFEKKAWATGKTALKTQSMMICMAYNFMRFVKELLHNKENIDDQKVIIKYENELKKRECKALKKGRSIHPFLKKIRRMPKLSRQFVSTVKSYFYQKNPLKDLIGEFRVMMEAYL